MDEPFGALDEIVRDHLNEQLLKLWAKTRKTVVFVTHSIPEAVFLSTKIVVLCPRPGRIYDVIESDLPRERTLDIRETPEFLKIAHRVREGCGGVRAGHTAMTIEGMPVPARPQKRRSMGFELPISTRVTVRPGPQGRVVVVQARARLWSMLFLMGWLGMWSFAGFSILDILASGSMKPGLSMFVMLWMVLWALGWLYGAANLLWMLAGEERLSISKTEVVKTVHTPILSRSWRYDSRAYRQTSAATR